MTEPILDEFDRANAERALLRAMEPHIENIVRVKCDVVLRAALHYIGNWSDSSEYALCNGGDEDQEVWRLYSILRQLILDAFAEGAGDLRLPAGPRYTECRLTAKGLERLRTNIPGRALPSRTVTAKIIRRSRGEPNPILPKEESNKGEAD